MVTNKNNRLKPKKPYPDFPLYAHCGKQWAKRILGKVHYFGPWEDWQAALKKYQAQREDLFAGRVPQPFKQGAVTLHVLCEKFMQSKELLWQSGELARQTLDDYQRTCARLLSVFGLHRQVQDLRADALETLRKSWSPKWNLTTVGNEIRRVRVVLKYAYDQDLIAAPIRCGQTFRQPSQRAKRREKRGQGPRMFEPAEIHAAITAATPAMRAMILLAINCGFGNRDVGKLPRSALNLTLGWVDHPRPKTEIERRCPLWPETILALRRYLERRPEPKDPAHADLVFITKPGGAWFTETSDNPVAKEFAKVLASAGVVRPKVGFYGLRHTFETVGGDTGDQVATNFLMGHAPASDDMAAVYREKMFPRRLKAVTDHVHRWLFGFVILPCPEGSEACNGRTSTRRP